jgi:type I restriction enzyme S subunit
MTKQNEKDAKRVPELRFKGFTDDWEQRKLGEIFNERKEKSENSNEQLLSVTINDGVVKSDTLDRKSNASKDRSNYKIVNPSDIAYNSMRMWQGALGVSSYHGIVSPAYTVISVRNVGKDNPYFYKYSFKRSKSLNVFRKHSQGLTPDTWNLKYPLFKQIKYQVPLLIEQEKIGQLFQSLDKTITLHEEQHRQLERLKKALLQKMFADETGYPALRFKGFTEKWEQSYLKDIASVNSGRDYKHLNKGNIPVYGTGGYMLSVDKALSNTKDGIGIGRKGTINNPYILKAPFWTVDTLFYVIPYNVDLNFLYGIFQKIDWRKKDESTGVPSLSKENINKTKFKIPAISEQKEIGTIFQNLDTLITLHQHKIDNLKRLKRALLQKMFV